MSPSSGGVEEFMDALTVFIERDLLGGAGGTVDRDAHLFEGGRIDSLKILQLIAFVEHWTGGVIPEPMIVMSNFRSIRTIAERFSSTAQPPLGRAASTASER